MEKATYTTNRIFKSASRIYSNTICGWRGSLSIFKAICAFKKFTIQENETGVEE
jgi:hypothetical protein